MYVSCQIGLSNPEYRVRWANVWQVFVSRERIGSDHGKFLLLPPPPPAESGRLLEITENFCHYPPPTESGRLLEITENVCYPPPPQSVVVPLLDYPLRIRPCSQHIYGRITRQTVFNFLQCYMLCVYCCLDQRKETLVQHLSQTDREGELNHYGTVFSVTRWRSATSTFCTYCGDWTKCT